jgi:hypothetical protein
MMDVITENMSTSLPFSIIITLEGNGAISQQFEIAGLS